MPEGDKKFLIGDFNKIMSDRNIFNQMVYTPLSEALRILDERQKDKELVAKIEKLLNNDIPEPLKKLNKYGIQFRQIATPNNEARHFLEITKGFGLKPVFMQYHQDKFCSSNNFKRSLGQLSIQGKINKKNEYITEKIGVIDFNKHNGKKLNDTVTHWNEPIIDFHKRLFDSCGLSKDCFFCDTSKWIMNHGAKPENYYKQFLLLFTCFGILFENFPIQGEDSDFSKSIILPSIEEVVKLTGLKPLIVPVGPVELDNDDYWYYYNADVKPIIKKNLML